MRFIYIDTKGKEVSIPTVDALALRIELGAITEATRLYDEAADRWAPAGEHEVFRSLIREQQERTGGFVAPPPPTPVVSPPPPPPPAPTPDAAPPARGPNPFDALEGPVAAEKPPEAPAKPVPAASEEPLGGLRFDLTLEPASQAGPAAAAPSPDMDFGMESGSGPEAAAEPDQKQDEKKEGDAFDFGGFGGMLTEDEGGADEQRERQEEAPKPPDSGLAIEGVLAASYGDLPTDHAPAASGHGMELEQPLSDLPIDQGGWSPKDRMKIESAEEEAGGADWGAGGDGQSDRPDRAARAKPAQPPGQERKSSPVPVLVGALVVLAIVGGGGWLGWTKLKNREPEAPVEVVVVDPPVALPAISAELEPRMRELADSTMADWLLALSTTLPAERGVPAEPDRAWLSGSYLAEASQYASIGQYWQALGAYVDDLEVRDADLYAALFRARLDSAMVSLDSAGVSAEDAQSMLDRAQAGFLAARPDRRPVYEQLRDITDAATGLHEFLVANEASIEYDPAAGGSSRDPVLEAVPATPDLGVGMWARVDSITQSLDALGALDLVTTDRLLGMFAAKLRTIPTR
jgi:hypothetical protein